MINLKSFFKNIFDTKEISDNNFKKFVEDHLARLTANNPGGIYAQLITDTTAAYTNYFGQMSDEDFAFANQQARTIAMGNVFNEFKKAASRQEGIVRAAFGKDSADYQDFYPHGISEYSLAILANAELLMQRMVTAANNHDTAIGQAFIDLFTDIKERFDNARSQQLLKKGEVTEDRVATAEKRDALEVQLMKNLFTIALNNIGDEEAGIAYFDQQIIRHDKKKEEEETPPVEG